MIAINTIFKPEDGFEDYIIECPDCDSLISCV